MTNHWIDIRNSKLLMVLGANPVENHPVVAQYINDAIKNGAKMVVVDPRRTRTAALAEATGGKFLRIRPGTNGAFMMGLFNYIITNKKYDAGYQTATANRTFTDAAGNAVAKNGWPKWTDALFRLNAAGTDYQRDASGFPVASTQPLNDATSDSDTVLQTLKRRAAYYTSAVVADICDIPGGAAAFDAVASMIAESHGDTTLLNPDGKGLAKGANFPGTILYAMGGTQFTHAAQDLRAYSMLQLLLGNMGRPGGGVNALRGIHNVQGSTDMGVLFSSMPGYSDVPSTTVTYGDYMDKLFGGARVKDASGKFWNQNNAQSGWNLQQHGFRNMMHWYFRQATDPFAADVDVNGDSSRIDNKNFDFMPKGNGFNHLEMFKNAKLNDPDANRVKCMVVLGQNPAVTEPNLTLVKDGLRNLDTLVVMDLFETETAGCDRKDGSVTYLLPSAGFVEEEGSVTNSGRWIQWREKAADPQGGSKADTEILLRLAKKLEEKGAFSHITLPKASDGSTFTSAYEGLYGSQYGWDPANAATTPFNSVAPAVAENIFKQMAHTKNNSADGANSGYGALWIYRGAYGGWAGVGNAANYFAAPAHLAASATAGSTSVTVDSAATFMAGDTCYIGTEQKTIDSIVGTTLNLTKPLKAAHSAGEEVKNVANRAKSRADKDASSNLGLYPNWGWAWLKNRRVMYNNGHVSGDVADMFVAPDQVARYFVHNSNNAEPAIGTFTAGLVGYSTTYRGYSKLKDKNSGDGSTTGGIATKDLGATMPKHWESHETPRDDLKTKYGTTGIAASGAVGTKASYPLVLTTIRVTEHFQGGPTTRNVPWLCELVPEPFIEINSADAATYLIKNGDNIYIDTPRASNIGPFKAVVGSGLATQQRVKKGVVAIPWHWGNKGISTGASANDLTIDALEANILMPEYKTCLCKIHK